MSKTKTKSKNIVGIIIAIVLVASLIGVGLYFALRPKNNEAVAVMECQVNPQAQFVLNSDNRVLSVNCVNEDAQILLQGESFVGKTADEAAQLFVKLSTEAGYIQVDSTIGKEVGITLTVKSDIDEAKILEIKNKVVNKVNEYFDENGIIAGAVLEVSASLQSAMTNIGYEVKDFATKSEEQIFEMLNETSKNVENIALSIRSEFFTKLNALRNKFADMTTVEDTITNLQKQIKAKQVEIDNYQTELNQEKAKLNNDKLSQLEKEQIKLQITAKQGTIDTAKQALNVINESLNKAKEEYKKFKAEFNRQLDVAIKELEKKSNEILKQAKTTLNTKIAETKTKIEEHKKYFNENKEAVKTKIEEYRATLKNA